MTPNKARKQSCENFHFTDNFLIEFDRAINTLSEKVNKHVQTPGKDFQDEEARSTSTR